MHKEEKKSLPSLNTLAIAIHANAVNKGFWEESDYQRSLSLISSKVGELVEADRTDNRARVAEFNEITEETKGDFDFSGVFEDLIKDSDGDELADIFIRILDLSGELGLDLDSVQEYEFMDHEGLVFVGDSIHAMVNRLNWVISNIANMEMQIGYIGSQFSAIMFRRLLFWVMVIADTMKIDLEWHIEQKMNYNASREPKHGKAY